jgi:alpha-galactosidase
MSSWVTDEPDHRDVEPASLEFRFLVAMAGVLGVGADLLNWTERDRARAAGLVVLYRRTIDLRRRYRIAATRTELSGVEAATGLHVPFTLAPDADVLVLDAVG